MSTEGATTLRFLASEISASISGDKKSTVGTFAVGGEVSIDNSIGVQPAPGERSGTATAKSKAPKNDHKSSLGPVVLRWDPPAVSETSGPTRAAFPVGSDADAEGFDRLLEDTQPATFGRGGEHVYDESYRKAQKLSAAEFCANFCPYEHGIIDTVCQVLLPSVQAAEDSRSIRAELYNMNIYSGPSGKFKPHVDTPRSTYQVGSLVVCLPMKHEGGDLVVRHDGQEQTFQWAEKSDMPTIQWAAFYSDCEHEVLEVKSGHRITLTYNLHATRGNSSLSGASAFNPASLPLYNQIQALVTSKKFRAKNRLLGFYSAHAYPHTDTEHGLPFCLKGIDMALYEIFRSMGLKTHLCAVVERPCDSYSHIPLGNEEISDGEADIVQSPSEKRARVQREEDWSETEVEQDDDEYGEWNPDRVLGLVSPAKSYDMIEEDSEIKDMLNRALRIGQLKFNTDRIVWLNQNNHKSRPQVHFISYGNEPCMSEVYSYFAMVVQIPRERDASGL